MEDFYAGEPYFTYTGEPHLTINGEHIPIGAFKIKPGEDYTFVLVGDKRSFLQRWLPYWLGGLPEPPNVNIVIKRGGWNNELPREDPFKR